MRRKHANFKVDNEAVALASSTSMKPAIPTALTATQDDVTCARSTNEGAGSRCTASLLITSMIDEQAA